MLKATLPLSRTTWTSVPTGWTDSVTSTYGTDCTTGTTGSSGQLNSSGDSYTIFFNAAPGTLDAYIKIEGTANSGNVFLVQISDNGSTWTDLGSYTGTGYTSCTNINFNLSSYTSSRYIRFIYQTKVSGNFRLDDVSITQTLPISLTKFNAFFQNKQVNLSWSKGDAKNFDKFVVEHSTNGVDFVAIEEIASRNSDDYATIHSNPAKGNNYYRLKMMDLDGSFKYSDTKTVTVKGAQEWSVYPTKATAMITASVSENEEATVQILSTNGQVMYTANSNGNTLVELPISNLSQGLYLVQIIEKGAVVFTERIIKE